MGGSNKHFIHTDLKKRINILLLPLWFYFPTIVYEIIDNDWYYSVFVVIISSENLSLQ